MSTTFRQARWNEPSLFEYNGRGRIGHVVPEAEKEIKKDLGDITNLVPASLLRSSLNLPELSEVEVVRHYIRLSQTNYCVDLGIYPLGSCTMKYNPKINDSIVSLDSATMMHPYQDESTAQGSLEIMYKLSKWLASITGTYRVTLQPAAGAHGEYTGVLIIRAFHRANKEGDKRTEMIIPDSAHGTNPASAAMAGFSIVVLPSGKDGCIDVEGLKSVVSEKTAGLMLTNPNTLGIFEKDIREIAKVVHEAGGLLYYDGANLNAILGKVRPGDMGFDVVHLNLHKTFSTPHGGGGPGSGPVGVCRALDRFLPIPVVDYRAGKYCLDYDRPESIGKVKGYYGNFGVFLRSFAYILSLGSEGLEETSEIATLNANYIAKKLLGVRGYALPYDPGKPRKHECVFSATPMASDTGVRALNVAKRLLDSGMHPPTNYFPQIVDEALMIEPTDTETKEEMDRFIDAMKQISEEAYNTPQTVMSSPHNTTVTKIDEVKAAHPKTMALSWKMYKQQKSNP